MFERPILTLIPTVNCKLGHNLDHIPASLERRECSAPIKGVWAVTMGIWNLNFSEGFKAPGCLLLSSKNSYIDA